jgi:hypothetical protein
MPMMMEIIDAKAGSLTIADRGATHMLSAGAGG